MSVLKYLKILSPHIPIYTNILFVSLISTSTLYSQSNDLEAAGYNIGIGTVFTTVGAIINKEKDQKTIDVIKNVWWQGAVGGYLNFESKRVIREVNNKGDWPLFWTAKIISEAGASIQNNAARNYEFGRTWQFNYGFNRLELDTKDNWKVSYKLRPVDFAFTVDAIFRYRFDLEESLKYGHPIFFTSKNLGNGEFIETAALATAGYIVFKDEFFITSLIKHEYIHTFQDTNYSIINNFYTPILNQYSEKNSLVRLMNKHIYLESHYIILRGLYILEASSSRTYYDNFFEQEAYYYSEK